MPGDTFILRRRVLTNEDGYNRWILKEETLPLPASQTALVVVDMWDRHWSAGATARCGALAVKINGAVQRARARGILIVHAPSDTMDFYRGHPARLRFLDAAKNPGGEPETIPETVPVAGYPAPVDSSDGGSDTPALDAYAPNTRVWKRQTEKIEIDGNLDLICGDEGDALRSVLRGRGVNNIIYTGVHTNMCVLGRSFGIKNMLRHGFTAILVRDLTDAMYNPEKPPYVDHDEGVRLIVEYIEKMYCPTTGSDQI
ncbi:MAG: cysteine hydrolase family protein [Treponema sp.]|jgi:nicotinamidase-related amidase|nr:cysteine hydrolase family protein [Treponema sp.]